MWSWSGVAAVGAGAAVGAWLRWGLSILLNPVFPTVPFGTLASNWIGGFLMGVAMELIGRFAALPPEMRLVMTTGFLGGLTTFSTFSGEMTTLLLRGDWGWTALGIALHVVGSIVLCVLGILCTRALLAGVAS
jgi:fluoride exporter